MKKAERGTPGIKAKYQIIPKTYLTLALPDIVVELKYLAIPVNWLSAPPPAILNVSYICQEKKCIWLIKKYMCNLNLDKISYKNSKNRGNIWFTWWEKRRENKKKTRDENPADDDLRKWRSRVASFKVVVIMIVRCLLSAPPL